MQGESEGSRPPRLRRPAHFLTTHSLAYLLTQYLLQVRLLILADRLQAERFRKLRKDLVLLDVATLAKRLQLRIAAR